MTAFAKGFRDTGGGCASSDNSDTKKKKDQSGPSDKVMHKSVSVQVDSVFGLHLTEGVYEIKKMETRSRSRLRSVIMICLFLAVAGIVGFGYFCNDQVSNNNNNIICKSFMNRRWPLLVKQNPNRSASISLRRIHQFISNYKLRVSVVPPL